MPLYVHILQIHLVQGGLRESRGSTLALPSLRRLLAAGVVLLSPRFRKHAPAQEGLDGGQDTLEDVVEKCSPAHHHTVVVVLVVNVVETGLDRCIDLLPGKSLFATVQLVAEHVEQ